MNRRDAVLALAALGAVPFLSHAQAPGKLWRVGVLSSLGRANALDPQFTGAFPLGMRDLGYVEGRNLALEWRYADGNVDRLPALAAELVQLKVDVLVAVAHCAALAAQKATTTIPIVMTTSTDPAGTGMVKSLARPGGNITGISVLSGELGPKRLELLRAIAPKISRVAVLLTRMSSQANITALEAIKAAGEKLGVTILPVEASTPEEIDAGFALMRKQGAEALTVLLTPVFQQQKSQIALLASKYRLPCIAADRMYADAGCLMSYGTTLANVFRGVATYVDKILKGANPGDLPIEQPTKFDFIINLKTAKALGITIPQSVLLRADEVIE